MKFVCKKCGVETYAWNPTCPVCSAEGTLEKKETSYNVPQVETNAQKPERLPSGFALFDKIFLGFLRGFLYFLHAMRGAGKTTFLLKVCSFLVSLGFKVVYFCFDEGRDGIMKKCLQYGLMENLPVFIFENKSGSVERALREHRPDFVVLDSLQRLAKYNREKSVGELEKLQKKAQRDNFALVVIGEEQRSGKSYIGSSHIGHILDVQFQLVKGLNDEVMISSPEKNRDTDDRTSRCFFRRTPTGLVEISESETGYLLRHTEKEIIGLASFISEKGEEFFIDEIAAALLDDKAKKPLLYIEGMNLSKSKNLLAVISKVATLSAKEITLRHNSNEKLSTDAEAACVMAVISLLLDIPLPVETVFIGGVDNLGYLLPVVGMEARVKRARALGYSRVIGPRAIGSQTAVWDEFDSLESLKREFFQ